MRKWKPAFCILPLKLGFIGNINQFPTFLLFKTFILFLVALIIRNSIRFPTVITRMSILRKNVIPFSPFTIKASFYRKRQSVSYLFIIKNFYHFSNYFDFRKRRSASDFHSWSFNAEALIRLLLLNPWLMEATICLPFCFIILILK